MEGEWEKCERETICENHIAASDWKIDYEKPGNYRNWVDPAKLDLTCKDSYQIGLIGSSYFIGFAVSALFVPVLADKYGRKHLYMGCYLLQLACYILIFFSTKIEVTIFAYAVVGICASGRVSIGTMYLNEFLPMKHQSIVTTLLNVGDASTMILQCLYYLIISNNWLYLHLVGIICGIILIYPLWKIPESPKYLYAKKHFDQSRQVLAHIAKMNGKPPSEISKIKSIVFDTE